jgi:hypothetical protein
MGWIQQVTKNGDIGPIHIEKNHTFIINSRFIKSLCGKKFDYYSAKHGKFRTLIKNKLKKDMVIPTCPKCITIHMGNVLLNKELEYESPTN